MVQADTLDCKQGIKTAEHRWDPSRACWPDATGTDAIENMGDVFGINNEPTWDDGTKPDLDLQALNCFRDCRGGLMRPKVVGVHAYDVQGPLRLSSSLYFCRLLAQRLVFSCTTRKHESSCL